MEPTIYKPGAYNIPGVYKGAGGIYKGRGIYKDAGGGYNGPFILLNNCDNLDADNNCISEIGGPLHENNNLPFGYLIDSSIFVGSKSIKRNVRNYIRIDDIHPEDVFTIEVYLSSMPMADVATDMYALSVFCLSSTRDGNSVMFIGGRNIYDFETVYPIRDWTTNYKAIQIPYSQNAHLAAVVNKNAKKVYCFVNGSKIGSYKYTDLSTNITQNGVGAAAVVEFICVRNGDFSNNLNSFDVPTQKYNL